MGKPELSKNQPKMEKNNSLRGTFASVLLLGTFIIVTWLAVFYLFIERM